MSAMNAAGGVVCFTGRPSSGKSTLGRRAAEHLREEGIPAITLDGDAVRAVLVPTPGYSPEERADFYATLTNLSVVLAYQGLWVMVPATYPRSEYRHRLRELAPRFVEVFVDATLAECEARDDKGLYRQARSGKAPDLPGLGFPYDTPHAPDVVAEGGYDDRALEDVLARVRQQFYATPSHAAL